MTSEQKAQTLAAKLSRLISREGVEEHMIIGIQSSISGDRTVIFDKIPTLPHKYKVIDAAYVEKLEAVIRAVGPLVEALEAEIKAVKYAGYNPHISEKVLDDFTAAVTREARDEAS